MEHRHGQELVARVAELVDRALVHVGEPPGVGLEDQDGIARGVERLADAAALGLVLDALADVTDDRDDTQPGVAFEGAEADLDRELAAVLAASEQAEAHAHRPGPRLDAVAGPVRAVDLPEPLGEEVVDRASEEIAAVVAEQLLEPAVDEQDLTRFVRQHDAVGRGVDEAPHGGIGEPDVGERAQRLAVNPGSCALGFPGFCRHRLCLLETP